MDTCQLAWFFFTASVCHVSPHAAAACTRVSGVYTTWSLTSRCITRFLLSRQTEDDRREVLSLVDSEDDDEQIFQDAVPRLPPLPNGSQMTLAQIHHSPPGRASARQLIRSVHDVEPCLVMCCLVVVSQGIRRTWTPVTPALSSRRTPNRRNSWWIRSLTYFRCF